MERSKKDIFDSGINIGLIAGFLAGLSLGFFLGYWYAANLIIHTMYQSLL